VLPLADVRVLAFEQYGAGPWGTLQLADLGADVIKVEDPAARGDVGRYVPPFQEGEDSLFFETFNRNKRSLSLDLRHVEAVEVLEDLVRNVDVVYSNLRGDQPRRLGLTYDQLRHVNPRVVCCSLSGFGMTGPRFAEGGYDYMMQGLAGWMSLTGDPDGPPTKAGLSLVDLSGGYVSALAVLAGLWRARREGVGCDCDVSLFETALAELMYVGTWAATKGHVPARMASSAHPSIVPFQNFETEDGWIVVACPKPKFWALLCDVIGRPELVSDPRFADFAARDRNRGELLPILEDAFRSRTSEDWLDVLGAAGVPSSAVNDVAAALADEQAVARGDVVEHEHPRFGTVRTIATPIRVGEGEAPVKRGPLRGEHTEEILVELCGYDRQRVRELTDAGVFGDLVLSAGRVAEGS
jgi:crotonobetainyl-CoA:carnitine CoA-transferase CaiB-like acyl-CoA transferase